jgi:hypothetical protein
MMGAWTHRDFVFSTDHFDWLRADDVAYGPSIANIDGFAMYSCLGVAIYEKYYVPSFEDLLSHSDVCEGYKAVITFQDRVPTYDDLSNLRNALRKRRMNKARLREICILAYKHGLTPDYDQHVDLGVKVDACMLEAMYKQGLTPDVRHGGPVYDVQVQAIKAKYWRRFCIVRKCWRKWIDCMYRPGGPRALAARRHFDSCLDNEGLVAAAVTTNKKRKRASLPTRYSKRQQAAPAVAMNEYSDEDIGLAASVFH